MGLKDSDHRRIGQVFRFPVLRAGEARGMRGRFIVAADYPAHAAGELLEFLFAGWHAGYRYPGLVVAGTGFVNDECRWPYTVELFLCFQVVELDKRHTLAERSDDDVVSGPCFPSVGQRNRAPDVRRSYNGRQLLVKLAEPKWPQSATGDFSHLGSLVPGKRVALHVRFERED
jgi:hypothetical protein